MARQCSVVFLDSLIIYWIIYSFHLCSLWYSKTIMKIVHMCGDFDNIVAYSRMLWMKLHWLVQNVKAIPIHHEISICIHAPENNKTKITMTFISFKWRKTRTEMKFTLVITLKQWNTLLYWSGVVAVIILVLITSNGMPGSHDSIPAHAPAIAVRRFSTESSL